MATQKYADNFNSNTENPLATNWSTARVVYDNVGLKGYSNGAAASTANVNCGSYVDVETFDNNQYAQCSILVNTFTGLILRYTNNDGYNVFVRDSGRLRISKMTDASVLYTISGGPYNSGGVLRAEVVGNVISVFWNGVKQYDYTDSSNFFTSGRPGIQTFHTSTTVAVIDDFSCGNTADSALPNVKSVNGLAIASVKNYNGLAIASVKSINGLA